MSAAFDPSTVERLGWRQGAVLGPSLRRVAGDCAPAGVVVTDDDWIIVTSHDCDVVNGCLEKEPCVEVLRAEISIRKAPDKQQVWGRNPRMMQLRVDDVAGKTLVLSLKVHERWSIARERLADEKPEHVLAQKARRLIAEWLAKRYIRAAFPTAFDARWRTKMKEWTTLLEKQSHWLQGVYLRLSTLEELEDSTPYKVDFIVAAPASAANDPAWAAKKSEIEDDVEKFWRQFAPSIQLAGVEVFTTNVLTLADIEPYQRFDADWLSFADDSSSTPVAADLQL